jgi:(p)ppGpp synthase/HD superfamily hydrolase
MFSTEYAHDFYSAIGLKRKYTGEPYYVHTDAVRKLVQSVTDDEQAADLANLHDHIEELKEATLSAADLKRLSKFTIKGIHDLFGTAVTMEVMDLTDSYESWRFPSMNRSTRKFYEAAKFSRVSLRVRVVKLADLIDNSADIAKHDHGFAKIYVKEKEMIVDQIASNIPSGDASLQSAFAELLKIAKERLADLNSLLVK